MNSKIVCKGLRKIQILNVAYNCDFEIQYNLKTAVTVLI